MATAWDTTLVSRLRPGSSALAYFEARSRSEDRVLVPAPAIAEVMYGYDRLSGDRGRRYGQWFVSLLGRPGARTLSFTKTAALAAGQMRSRRPLPPVARKSDRRSKAERRVAWVLDIHIAATAWSFGVPVATENVADFTRLSELLAELYPRAKPLDVLSSPL